MEPFPVSVRPKLDEFGAVLSLSGVLNLDGYHLGQEQLSTPDGVAYDVTLTNTGEGIVLAGTVSADAQGVCARCLTPVTEHVQSEVEGYYLLEPSDEVEGYEQDEYDVVAPDGTIDIAGPLEAGLVYGTPFVFLCKPDCKGLCPHCGADLNEGPCGCQEKEDGIDPDNPFAVLKNLTFDDSDES